LKTITSKMTISFNMIDSFMKTFRCDFVNRYTSNDLTTLLASNGSIYQISIVNGINV